MSEPPPDLSEVAELAEYCDCAFHQCQIRLPRLTAPCPCCVGCVREGGEFHTARARARRDAGEPPPHPWRIPGRVATHMAAVFIRALLRAPLVVGGLTGLALGGLFLAITAPN